MNGFSKPSAGDRTGSQPATADRTPPPPISADPFGQLEREQAVFDLADAAQADTRAATALERGDLAGSRELSRLAHYLYGRADTHRRHACEGKAAPLPARTATPVGAKPNR